MLFTGMLLLAGEGILRAQVSDSFTDGDFTSNPTWIGQTTLFTINASQQLQLNDAAAGSAALSTSFPGTSLANREWQLWVRQSFAGSDNNQSRIYLSANGAPGPYTGTGTAGVQGYFLKLGEAGSADAIKFCRDNGSGSISELASGTASLINSSFTIRLKVIRNASGQWTVLAAPGGGNNFQTELTVTDATYTSSTHLGVVCLYTSSNADQFFFDDFYFGDIVVDATPPNVLQVAVPTSTSLHVTFSESVQASGAEQVSNYTVPGIGAPLSAALDGPAAALLTFAAPFPSNEPQVLEVSNIADLADNTMLPSSHPFTWLELSPGAYRSVVFNEVLADPTPSIQLPEAEFVELHNPTSQTFDLAGWKFINSTVSTTLPAHILAPGGYVILCDDELAVAFGSLPVIGISSFSALNNTGDSLTLLNATDELIDILVYSISWYDSPEKDDGGWSLEQINPQFPCPGSANWRESSNPGGGTPGSQNSVYAITPDTTPPVVSGVNIHNPTSITIQFSETMDPGISGSLAMLPLFNFSALTWNSTSDALTASITPGLEAGIPYILELALWTDCSGNVMDPAELDLVIGSPPQAGDIQINEIMSDPDPQVDGPAAEYIELYNRSNTLIDLRGCAINEEAFEQQTLIGPGSYLVVGDLDQAFSFIAYPGTAFLPGFPTLTNSGMELVLQDAGGLVLDQVEYDITWYRDAEKDDGGWSLERINPEDPCSDRDNWTASTDPRGMTAGEQNSVYSIQPDIQVPHPLLILNEPMGSITLLFDEPMDGSLDNLVWEINGEIQPTGGVIINSSDPRRIIFTLPTGLTTGVVHTLQVTGLADCWGNTMSASTLPFGIPEEAQAGDLIINEILFNPNSPGQDFVEIYNNSPRAISLQGWGLAGDDAGQPSEVEDISQSAFVLLPRQYLVLTEPGHSIEQWYPFAKRERIWLMQNLPTLNIDEGVCYLTMPDLTPSDRMAYTADMHFPLLDEVKGVSLERIDFNRPADDLTNWSSAAESQGFATPGYVNSQAFSTGFGESQITLDPEVFSPDNDGFQDNLVISYKHDEPGLVGNITIFNSEGMRVRRLMRNELLGVQGQISWNGFGDAGEKLPIGIYIIYFEVFNSSGDVTRIKKSCVLAHPLGSN